LAEYFTHLQVMQPVLTLGTLALFLLGATSGVSDMLWMDIDCAGPTENKPQI
jgi:hypothetical protein